MGLKECSNCGGHEFPLSNCSRCKISSYCGKACQKQHWKDGHKLFCIPFEQKFQKGIVEPKYDAGVLCMICQASLISRTMILSCSHVFHIDCIWDLLQFNEAKTCPICRSSLNDQRSTKNLMNLNGPGKRRLKRNFLMISFFLRIILS